MYMYMCDTHVYVSLPWGVCVLILHVYVIV